MLGSAPLSGLPISGVKTASAPSGAITGSGTATGATAGTLTGRGVLTASGTATGASSGTLSARGPVTAAGTATGATAGTLTARGPLTATSGATGASTATLTALAALAATGTATGAATGALTGRGALTASGAAIGATTATLTALGGLTGTGAATGASAGMLTATGLLTASGTAMGASAGTLTAGGVVALTGSGSALGSSAGTLTQTTAAPPFLEVPRGSGQTPLGGPAAVTTTGVTASSAPGAATATPGGPTNYAQAQNQAAGDDITLAINGQIISGWTGLNFDRQIDHMDSRFSVNMALPLQTTINPFDACVLKISGTPIVTGYIEEIAPTIGANLYSLTISGRSKTLDLLECTPDVSAGQYKGYTLEQIARAICGLFGISVVVQTNATQIFPDATLQRGETAFTFLERLGRLAGVLLTDDANGNLVLCTTGTMRAGGSLTLPGNIVEIRPRLDVKRRFSIYIVKGQRALGSAAGQSESTDTTDDGPAPVITNLRATATDKGVPRYRPKVSLAETQLDQAGMQRRADWERSYFYARATAVEIDVLGWRDANNALWQINTLITVTAPAAGISQDLLIAGVTFTIDARRGRMTRLRLGPVEGFTPDPGQVKLHKKGKAPAGDPWAGY